MPGINKSLDGIIKKTKPKVEFQPYYIVPFVAPVPAQRQRALYYKRPKNIYYFLAATALTAAFMGGMTTALKTPRTEAETEIATTAASSRSIPMANVQVVDAAPAVSADVLFNTPIEMLKEYLSPKPTPDIIGDRTAKLTAYLKSRNSPLADKAQTIAEQDHWKLILAISFAESTLGKKCYFNNCSGIGGSSIRTYRNLEGWILDFNRLLEKRYKDKTLEQMCGVYVQPCNPNWLLATRQILTELDAQGIE
jgi:hypothetical protein